MANGSFSQIELVHEGDTVLSFNEFTRSIDTSLVNHVHAYQTNSPNLVTIQFSHSETGFIDSISATLEHPFYSNGIWIKASDLKAGHELKIYRNNALETVINTKVETRKSDVDMVYNLNTTSHTFIANGVVVHNK